MIKIGNEWTPDERLALISEILDTVRQAPPLTPIRLISRALQDCALVVDASAEFLELNRRNFSEFIGE